MRPVWSGVTQPVPLKRIDPAVSYGKALLMAVDSEWWGRSYCLSIHGANRVDRRGGRGGPALRS
jgi:hypothetical protein